MRKFKFAKLVRDKIVEQIISVGNKPNWRIFTDDEYVQELKNKIVEESSEIPWSKDTEEVVKELAGIQEIIDNLLLIFKVSKKQFNNIKKEKNNKNGSFKKKHYIDYVVTSDNDTKWVKYYLDNPDKYPELKIK